MGGGKQGAPHRCRFVGAQQSGRVHSRVSGKQSRHQDQATAAHHGIDKTCQARQQGNDQQVHMILSVEKKAPLCGAFSI
jgi:hypothetical protein